LNHRRIIAVIVAVDVLGVDGVGVDARFGGCIIFSPGHSSCGGPTSMATDGAGNVYVTESPNHTIRKITPAGMVTTLAGSAGQRGSADGVGADARFYYPQGIAVDTAGNVYVGDSANHTIRKITPAGVVSTLAGAPGQSGSADGAGTDARFNNPAGVATDYAGNLFVTDNGNFIVRMITPTGVVKTLAGTAGRLGSVDGTGAAATFGRGLWGVATDSAGNVYVADADNCTIRKITLSGVVTTVVGQAGQWGFLPGELPGFLNGLSGVAISGSSLYISLAGSNAVAIVTNVP